MADLVKRTKETLRVRAYLAAGLSTSEIAERMKTSLDYVGELVDEIFVAEERSVSTMTPVRVAAVASLHVENSIRQLDEIAAESRRARQPAAAVGAIKAKHAILERHVEQLQQLGLMDKTATKSVGMLANATREQLESLVSTKNQKLLALARQSRPFEEFDEDDDVPPQIPYRPVKVARTREIVEDTPVTPEQKSSGSLKPERRRV